MGNSDCDMPPPILAGAKPSLLKMRGLSFAGRCSMPYLRRDKGRIVSALSEMPALGSRSRLGAHATARKPKGPVSTRRGEFEHFGQLGPPRLSAR